METLAPTFHSFTVCVVCACVVFISRLELVKKWILVVVVNKIDQNVNYDQFVNFLVLNIYLPDFECVVNLASVMCCFLFLLLFPFHFVSFMYLLNFQPLV